MNSEKIKIKLYLADPDSAPLEGVVELFHRWIREDTLGQLMIDVADYAHVHHGPGVVLIGHAVDYGLDQGEGRPGLLYFRKREAPPPEQRVSAALRAALHAARLFERDAGRTFRGDELLLSVPDRLHATNDDAAFERLRPSLDAGLSRVFPERTLTREGGPRDPFTVRVRAPEDAPVAELLARL